MTGAPPEGAVVLDTMVMSWLLDDRPNPLADRYRRLIGAAPALLAFQTVMELRFGAIRAGWGELRRRRLERRIAELTVLQPDDEMIEICAQLRAELSAGRACPGGEGARRRPMDCGLRASAQRSTRLP